MLAVHPSHNGPATFSFPVQFSLLKSHGIQRRQKRTSGHILRRVTEHQTGSWSKVVLTRLPGKTSNPVECFMRDNPNCLAKLG